MYIHAYLGVHIDQHLKWNTHILEITKKISKNIGIIRRIAYLLPPRIVNNLYFTLIYPYLTYCNFIWTSTYNTHLTNLRVIQKKAIRLITGSAVNSHTRPLYLKFNLLNLSQIKFIQTGVFMYQYGRNLLPPAFLSYFSPIIPINDTIEAIENTLASSQEPTHVSSQSNTRVRSFGITFLWSFVRLRASFILNTCSVHTQ